MKLKRPAQPLLFCFSGVTPLCAAAEALYQLYPGLGAELCLYRGRYFLSVYAGLSQRRQVLRAASESGSYLGPAQVLYAYCSEHGRELSRNALTDLGANRR